MIKCNGQAFQLDSVEYCKARYEAGKREYLMKDKRWGSGVLKLSVLAYPQTEGAVWKFVAENFGKAKIEIVGMICETRVSKFKRAGDIGKFDGPEAFDAPAQPKMLSTVAGIMPQKGAAELYFSVDNTVLSTGKNSEMCKRYKNGMIETAAGTRYKALVIPGNNIMPSDVIQHISQLKAQGAKIIKGDNTEAMAKAANPEMMRKLYGLKLIRRNNKYGHHYFIANLTDHDIKAQVPIATGENAALWYNPMNESYHAAVINEHGELDINLKSGESRILLSAQKESAPWLQDKKLRLAKTEPQTIDKGESIDLTANTWKLSFTEEAPKVEETFSLQGLKTWESLSDKAKVTMGTGVYETTFKLSKEQAKKQWSIDLGDVRESARVYINGHYIGCAWAVPYILHCKDALSKGKNTIRIEVTNLPANRIAALDREGVKWRKMKEINVVDINYKKTTYDKWEPVPSGLNSTVKLVEVKTDIN